MSYKQELEAPHRQIGPVGGGDSLVNRVPGRSLTKGASFTPFFSESIPMDKPEAYYKKPPATLPRGFRLPEPQGLANDYSFLLEGRVELDPRVSIVVLTHNRIESLARTLASLCNQTYSSSRIEVIVVDDGSSYDTLFVIKRFKDRLNIRYYWHPDVGLAPSRARNAGVRIATNDFVILLDVDMLPSKRFVAEYVRYASTLSHAVLIGPRKHGDLNGVSEADILADPDRIDNLQEANAAGSVINGHLRVLSSSDDLKGEDLPFRAFNAANAAFSRKWFLKVGGFDENFVSPGYEGQELAFRFFNDGAYFIPVTEAWALHQDSANGVNKTDRIAGMMESERDNASVYPYSRRLDQRRTTYAVPRVSIYIPAYNAEATICDAIESALMQSVHDLEVCVCDDGSTDRTLAVLERYYANNPRVRWVSQPNRGIGAASNTAVRMCRGLYVGQLDSDDILAVDAVEKCLPVLEGDIKVGLVYTSFWNQLQDGQIVPGYHYPVFTREKLITSMIVHHFRMFRRRDWARAGGFSERLKNAVDYDFYLKLAEVSNVVHLNLRAYLRRLHGENTSIRHYLQQNQNAMRAVNDSLRRWGTDLECRLESDDSPELLFRRKA